MFSLESSDFGHYVGTRERFGRPTGAYIIVGVTSSLQQTIKVLSVNACLQQLRTHRRVLSGFFLPRAEYGSIICLFAFPRSIFHRHRVW
jgi:hypothetical protein